MFHRFLESKSKVDSQCIHSSFDFLDDWLQRRGLLDFLTASTSQGLTTRDGAPFRRYDYRNRRAPIKSHSNWKEAYHGTWFYGLWNILYHGVLLESNSEDDGHEFWCPGVYVSECLDTAKWYARAHQLFDDGNFFRCLLRVKYDPEQVRVTREKGGGQIVVPSCAVCIQEVLFLANVPPKKGDERMEFWDDDLEIIPENLRQQDVLRFRPTRLTRLTSLLKLPLPSLGTAASASRSRSRGRHDRHGAPAWCVPRTVTGNR